MKYSWTVVVRSRLSELKHLIYRYETFLRTAHTDAFSLYLHDKKVWCSRSEIQMMMRETKAQYRRMYRLIAPSLKAVRVREGLLREITEAGRYGNQSRLRYYKRYLRRTMTGE